MRQPYHSLPIQIDLWYVLIEMACLYWVLPPWSRPVPLCRRNSFFAMVFRNSTIGNAGLGAAGCPHRPKSRRTPCRRPSRRAAVPFRAQRPSSPVISRRRAPQAWGSQLFDMTSVRRCPISGSVDQWTASTSRWPYAGGGSELQAPAAGHTPARPTNMHYKPTPQRLLYGIFFLVPSLSVRKLRIAYCVGRELLVAAAAAASSQQVAGRSRSRQKQKQVN
jgi:hypothetical protein